MTTDEKKNMPEGYPFTLICLNCGTDYEGCYINQPCPRCRNHSTESIRYMTNEEWKSEITNPDDCTIENMCIEITGSVAQ